MIAVFWHDERVSAGVIVDGWTAVGFTYPTEFHGRVSLDRLDSKTSR